MMSGKLIDLKRRIQSVKNTQKVTKAMKSVSAAKLRKSLILYNNIKQYLGELEKNVGVISGKIKKSDYEFLNPKKEGKEIIVIVSSDKGLCGAFNTHIIKRFKDYIKDKKDYEIICIGKKIHKYIKKSNLPIKESFINTMNQLSLENSLEITQRLKEEYLKEDIKSISLIYTVYESGSQQRVEVKGLFPFKFDQKDLEENIEESELEYIIEPSPKVIFNSILNEYIKIIIYCLLLKSMASEQHQRMIAMDKATKNAYDLIRELTLNMNKLRQEAITRELLEIISTTEAMK